MRTTVTLAFVASLQLGAGLVFQFLVLKLIGVGGESDAFIAAQAVPTVLTAVLAISLQNVWQPKLAVSAQEPERWQRDQEIAHAQALLSFSVAAGFLLLTMSLWIPLIYFGLDASAQNTVTELTPFFLFAGVLNGGSAILTTAQRGRDRLISSDVVLAGGTLLSLAALAPVVASWGIAGAAYLIAARALLIWFVLIALVGGSWPRWGLALVDRETWRRLPPLLASSGVYKSAPLVDRFWSAMGPMGSVTLLGMAQAGMSAIAAVLERALSMPSSPRIARLVANKSFGGALALYRRAVARVALASIIVGMLALLGKPMWIEMLIRILTLSVSEADAFWALCVLLLGYMFVGAAGTPVVAIFYALGDTRTPAALGLLGFGLGVVAKSTGFLSFGLKGLALATTLYYLLNLIFLIVAVERRVGRLRAAPAAA